MLLSNSSVGDEGTNHIMKQIVIERVQALKEISNRPLPTLSHSESLTGMNQIYLLGSPNSAATLPPMLAMTGIGQNDKP